MTEGLLRLAHRLQHWPTDSLRQYAANARTHSDAQIDQICASILEFGFTRPILAEDDRSVIAGHGSLAAAIKLGMSEVPVVVLTGLTPAQKRAYILADNRLALEAGWDEELLTKELAALRDEGFDLALTGFNDEELAQFLDTADGGGGGDEFVADPPANPITRPGDVWTCGRHRIICGSATNPAIWKSLCRKGHHMVTFTSPPYGIATSARIRDHYVPGASDRRRSLYRKHDDSPDKWPALMRAWSALALKHTGAVICNVQMLAENKRALLRWCADLAEHLVDFAIWDKGSGPPQMQANILNNAFEFLVILSAKKDASRTIPLASFHGTQPNIVRIAPHNEMSDVHRAVMPVPLAEWAIALCSEAAEFVDPFGGTGTTLIACERQGRAAQLIEQDPAYVDVSVRRWQETTEQDAVLESTGESFNERSPEVEP